MSRFDKYKGIVRRNWDKISREELNKVIEEVKHRHTTPQYEFKVGDKVIDCHGEQRTITGFLTQDLVWLDHVDICSVSQCLKKVEDGME